MPESLINGRHHGHVIEAPSNAVAANADSKPGTLQHRDERKQIDLSIHRPDSVSGHALSESFQNDQ